MITTDRSLIRLNLYHPSSSLVVSNPSEKLAVAYEISIDDEFSDQNNNQKPVKSMLGFDSFQVAPVRGIVLPYDSQLIKISCQVSQPQGKKLYSKRLKRHDFPHEMQIAKLHIKCLYLLEYNKQQIVTFFIYQQAKILNSPQNQSTIHPKDLQRSQTHTFMVFITTQKNIYESDRIHDKPQLKSVTKHLSVQNNNQNNENGNRASTHTLIEEFKKNLNQINVNSLTSSNYLKNLNSKTNQQHSANGEVKLENSRLNADYDLVRNKLTLSDIEKRKSSQKSNQIFKVFENTDFPHPVQSKVEIKTSSVEKYDKQNNNPFSSRKDVAVDESFVIQNYKHKKPTLKHGYHRQRMVGNSKSVELIILAIVAALFVSLGNHFKLIFFSQQ